MCAKKMHKDFKISASYHRFSYSAEGVNITTAPVILLTSLRVAPKFIYRWYSRNHNAENQPVMGSVSGFSFASMPESKIVSVEEAALNN